MNYRMVLFVLGRLLGIEALLMAAPLICALIYGESVLSFIIPMVILLGLSLALTLKPPKEKLMHARDGFVSVGLSWIIMSFFGAIPLMLGTGVSFVDGFFEIVSGFTTTGSSIYPSVEVLDRSILLWRSVTNWIGGMGVLVFVLAIMPKSDLKSARFMHIMKAESPGPSVGKVVPKISETSRIMYGIYIGMTATLFVLLLCGGMPLFDSVCHSLSTAGTGGFGIKNDSLAGYPAYAQYVIAAFMILFGINFNIYYLLLIRQFLKAIKSEELWTYLIIVATSVGAITLCLFGFYNAPAMPGATAEESFRMAFFQVASLISTSGFSTVDFNIWPSTILAILLTLMFIGGSAGCTAGGMKVARIILLLKNGTREIGYILNPRAVKSVKFEGKVIDHETIRGTTSYIIVYFVLFAASTLSIIAIDSCDLVTGFSSVASCLNNIGPALGLNGPASNFGWMTDASKLILSFDMLAGRLELFPILILFSPSTWKKVM